MTRFTRHPAPEARTRFADDESSGRERDVVGTHVAGCDACAAEVAWTRGTSERLRALPSPVPDDAMFARALARRAAGERVLLPLDDAPVSRSTPVSGEWAWSSMQRSRWMAAAMLTIAAVGAWWAFAPTGLDAAPVLERLRIVSAAARPDTRVTVEYSAMPALASQESLLVRAYVRGGTAGDRARWLDPLLVLHRVSGKRYRGAFTWPSASVVTASVESFDGSVVDANDGALVDLLETDANGVPTFDALVRGSMPRGESFMTLGAPFVPPAVRARMAELMRRFPDEPESWALSTSVAPSPSFWDTWFGSFARRTRALERLDRQLSAAPQLAARARRAMVALALSQEEPEVAAEWTRRVGADSLVAPWRTRFNVVAEIVARRDAGAARAFLRDSLGTSSSDMLAVGFGTFQFVGAAGDHAAIVPCTELQAAFARANGKPARGRRPLGVTARAYEDLRARWRERWNEVVSLCGVPYPERATRFRAWARAHPWPDDQGALTALWRDVVSP